MAIARMMNLEDQYRPITYLNLDDRYRLLYHHTGGELRDWNIAKFGKLTQACFNQAIERQVRTLRRRATLREEFVVRLRYGLPVFGRENLPKTYKEIGTMQGVTGQRIRQIEAKALRRLRHPSYSKIFWKNWIKLRLKARAQGDGEFGSRWRQDEPERLFDKRKAS